MLRVLGSTVVSVSSIVDNKKIIPIECLYNIFLESLQTTSKQLVKKEQP